MKFLITIASIFFILLICFLLDLAIIRSDKTPLLGAMGIILSAFIASESVMRNIKNTEQLKKNERKYKEIKEKKFIKYILTQMKFEYENFISISSIKDMKYNSTESTYYFRLNKYVPKIQNLWVKLIDENYLKHLDNNINGQDFQIIYENITELINEFEHVDANDERSITFNNSLIGAFNNLIEKIDK